jgi:hypothetical protein
MGGDGEERHKGGRLWAIGLKGVDVPAQFELGSTTMNA